MIHRSLTPCRTHPLMGFSRGVLVAASPQIFLPSGRKPWISPEWRRVTAVISKEKKNHEHQVTEAFKNILAAGRYTWLEGGTQEIPATCRVVGRTSPVVHNHSLVNFCPGYLGQRLQQANGLSIQHWPMEECHLV